MADQWIEVMAGVDRLAQRFYDHVAPDWMAAYPAAWSAIRRALESGELRSRVPSRERFEFKHFNADGRVTRNIALQSEGVIPSTFWHHYEAAAHNHSGDLITIADALGAHQAGNDFWFLDERGVIDGHTLRGSADGVELDSQALPMGASDGPKKLGRKPGKSRFDDTELVLRAKGMCETLGITKKDAARRLLSDAQPGASEDATFDRIYRAICA